jgi:mRNA-degrading endonuclease RelE of RelBE toxin-antitoxin system
MDKIQKALAKLSDSERLKIKIVLEKINSGIVIGLDLKKLKGRDDVYRVRIGKIRIIYRQVGDKIFILAVERRNDNTYNF